MSLDPKFDRRYMKPAFEYCRYFASDALISRRVLIKVANQAFEFICKSRTHSALVPPGVIVAITVYPDSTAPVELSNQDTLYFHMRNDSTTNIFLCNNTNFIQIA